MPSLKLIKAFVSRYNPCIDPNKSILPVIAHALSLPSPKLLKTFLLKNNQINKIKQLSTKTHKALHIQFLLKKIDCSKREPK